MSRWSNDPEDAACRLIARALDAIDVQGHVLIANQAGAGDLAARLAARGVGCTRWVRRLSPGEPGPAQPWPPAGNFDAVLLRLPKGKEEQEMATHAAISVLAPTGRLIVYGGNAEGIRSAAGAIAGLCGAVATLCAMGHGRVLAAHRPRDLSPIRGSLSAWRQTTMLTIAGVERPWVSYPGVFAAGRIDEATALLLAALPRLPTGARLLDFGCGSGAIGAGARALNASCLLDTLDSDAVALVACRENVPEARSLLGRGLGDAGATRYHAILSNPPLHLGIAEDHTLLHELIAQAPRHLQDRGVLQIVVPRRLALDKRLAREFPSIAIAAQNPRFRVWRAQRGSLLGGSRPR
jgi:16S rRNA (guanine1207-N2)-methyltransferase